MLTCNRITRTKYYNFWSNRYCGLLSTLFQHKWIYYEIITFRVLVKDQMRVTTLFLVYYVLLICWGSRLLLTFITLGKNWNFPTSSHPPTMHSTVVIYFCFSMCFYLQWNSLWWCVSTRHTVVLPPVANLESRCCGY